LLRKNSKFLHGNQTDATTVRKAVLTEDVNRLAARTKKERLLSTTCRVLLAIIVPANGINSFLWFSRWRKDPFQ
jgi:hypothetical protein